MKIIARAGLLAFAVALAWGSACDDSDNNTGGGGAGGASTGGSGGSAVAGTGGNPDAGAGGVVGTGGTPGGGAGGSSTGMGGAAAATKNVKASEGGTVTADGLTVVIPPGALMADTDITVAVSDGAALPGAATLLAKVYDLGPTGTMFLKPVTVAIDFDAAKLAAVAPKVATVAFLQAGAWVALAGSFTNGTKATAPTTHFTPFGVVITDPVIAACVGMALTACQACCKSTFPSGESKVIPAIIQTCACAATAPCNAQCATNVCVGMAVTPACQTCFNAETSKSNSVCFDQGLIACQLNSDCKDYETCGLSCK